MGKQSIWIDNIPDGDMIVGFVASLKVLGESGDYYWAHRSNNLGGMEKLGMATSMAADYSDDLRNTRSPVEE